MVAGLQTLGGRWYFRRVFILSFSLRLYHYIFKDILILCAFHDVF